MKSDEGTKKIFTNTGLLNLFLSETSLHGISQIKPNAPMWVKISWFTIFLSMAIFFGIGCYDQLERFLHHRPLATIFKIKSNRSLQSPTPFLCTTNRFWGSKIRELQVSDKLLEALNLGFYNAPPVHGPPISDEEIESILGFAKWEYRNLKNRLGVEGFKEIVDLLLPGCPEVVEGCRSVERGRYDCCNESIRLLGPFGACFGFPMTIYTATLSFQLFLKSPRPEDITTVKLTNYLDTGFLLCFSQHSVSDAVDTTGLYNIPMGFRTLANIKLTKFR